MLKDFCGCLYHSISRCICTEMKKTQLINKNRNQGLEPQVERNLQKMGLDTRIWATPILRTTHDYYTNNACCKLHIVLPPPSLHTPIAHVLCFCSAVALLLLCFCSVLMLSFFLFFCCVKFFQSISLSPNLSLLDQTLLVLFYKNVHNVSPHPHQMLLLQRRSSQTMPLIHAKI